MKFDIDEVCTIVYSLKEMDDLSKRDAITKAIIHYFLSNNNMNLLLDQNSFVVIFAMRNAR